MSKVKSALDALPTGEREGAAALVEAILELPKDRRAALAALLAGFGG